MVDQPLLKEYIAGIQNTLQCSICLDLLKTPVSTKCGHQFCSFCIMSCVKRRACIPCPLCKEPISKRGLKSREKLGALTDAIRELVYAYEEDSGYAYSAPLGPARVKDMTCTPETRSQIDRFQSVERVAMSSLENTDHTTNTPDLKTDNETRHENDPGTAAGIITETKSKRKRGDKSPLNDDTNSLFSAEKGTDDETNGARPAPDIFAEEDLCPKKRGKKTRKYAIMKVKNWLSRLPSVMTSPVDDDVEVDEGGKDDSQSSDQTVLLECDADETMDISSQNATIAPESSRSISLSSGTSPNQPKRFFKNREQKPDIMKVPVVSPNSNTDDPYAFPSSATKTTKKQQTRKSKSLNSTENRRKSPNNNTELKRGSKSATFDTMLLDSTKYVNEVPDQKLPEEDDFVEEVKASKVEDCFGPDEAENLKSKATRTYAQTTRRFRFRGRKAKLKANRNDENEEEDLKTGEIPPLQRMDAITQEQVEPTLEVGADAEPPTKKRKAGTEKRSGPACERINDELENAESFQLDIMTASQQVRETKSKREERSLRAKHEVRKILGQRNENETETSKVTKNETMPTYDQNQKQRDDTSANDEPDDDVEMETKKSINDVEIETETMDNTGGSDAGSTQVILEMQVKNSEQSHDGYETVKRIIVSPVGANKSKSKTSSLDTDGETPGENEKQLQKQSTGTFHPESQTLDTLEPVSILVGDSEPLHSPVKESQKDVTPRAISQNKETEIGSQKSSISSRASSPIIVESSRKLGSSTRAAVNHGLRCSNEVVPDDVNQCSRNKEDFMEDDDASAASAPGGECEVLKCRDSDSSEDELPDLSNKMSAQIIGAGSGSGGRTRNNVNDSDVDEDVVMVDDVRDVKNDVVEDIKNVGERNNDDVTKSDATTSNGTGDRTESITLSVSQVQYENAPLGGLVTPLGGAITDSRSSISSVDGQPRDQDPNLTSSGRHSLSKLASPGHNLTLSSPRHNLTLTSPRHNLTLTSPRHNLTESQNLTLPSQLPTTQMQEHLQLEVNELSRLIREKEAQLMQMSCMRTQGESTVGPDSDSDSDLFASQDATVYEQDEPTCTKGEMTSLKVTTPGRSRRGGRPSPVFSPTSSPAPPTPPCHAPPTSIHASPTTSPAPPTPPCHTEPSIIAPTPRRKSPKSMAAEIARTFSSIKRNVTDLDNDDDVITTVENKTSTKKDWKRIRTVQDSDSESEMVPNSLEEITPKRGTLDVFLTKKRLIESLPTNNHNTDKSQPEENSSSLLQTGRNKSSTARQKGSDLVKGLQKFEHLREMENVSKALKSSPVVAKGGGLVLPSHSRSRSGASPETSLGKKNENEDNDDCVMVVDTKRPHSPTVEAALSESCDFLAAVRTPSPVKPSISISQHNDDRSQNDQQPNLNIAELKTPQQNATSDATTAPHSRLTEHDTRTPRSIDRVPDSLRLPPPFVESPLPSLVSPYQGELIRLKREQCRGLVVSGLDSHSRDYVHKFARKFDFTFSQNFNDKTSHVIVQTVDEGDLVCERTLKYFLGIAGRCWVLSKQWLIDSVEQEFLEPEDSYEIKGDTVNGSQHNGPWRARNARNQLLSDFTICCHGQFSNLARPEIVKLIELCGGEAVVDENEFSTTTGGNKWRRLILAEPHENLRSSYFLALKKKYGMPVVSREWLLDSVAKYQVQKLKDYSLCLIST